jgi:carnitine O-palmitoyltransferase 1
MFQSRTFYGMEGCLPGLPLPALKDSIEKYLDSVSPLFPVAAFTQHCNEVREASNGWFSPFAVLQRALWRESLFKRNWLSKWWLKYVYLQKRSPVAFFSNYYLIHSPPTGQLADPLVRCCAHLRVIQTLILKRWGGKGELVPFMLRSRVPYSTENYKMAFGVTRIPGDSDLIQIYEKSRHVAVIRYNEFFCFDLIDSKGEAVKAEQLLANLRYLLKLPKPEQLAIPVAALTSEGRGNWSQNRKRWFATGLNKASIAAIESALFVVCLDDVTPQTDTEAAIAAFCGDGGNRWFDKSINYIIAPNGRVGLNCEHATLDCHVPTHLFQALLQKEEQYIPSSDVRERSSFQFNPKVKKLQWMVMPGLESTVSVAMGSFSKLLNDSNVHVFNFFAYGKAFIKQCHANANSWLQMCLQLAFFRHAKRFALTYESCELRYFAAGRTECIRPLSTESVDWCRKMCNPHVSREDRLAALQAAMKVHVRRARDAEKGKGFDRHLFGLFVTAVELKNTSAKHVLSKMLSVPFDLSTAPLGGGFCASTKTGYGVGFRTTKNSIFFHVHSWRSSSQKGDNSQKFSEFIQQAALDVYDLFPLPGE